MPCTRFTPQRPPHDTARTTPPPPCSSQRRRSHPDTALGLGPRQTEGIIAQESVLRAVWLFPRGQKARGSFVPLPSTSRGVLEAGRHAAGSQKRGRGAGPYRTECFSRGMLSSAAAASSRNQSSCPVWGWTRAAGRGFCSEPSRMRCRKKRERFSEVGQGKGATNRHRQPPRAPCT